MNSTTFINSIYYRYLKDNFIPSWGFATAIYASPAMRSLAIIPAFGYLIAFNDTIDTFLSNSDELNTIGINVTETIREVYYGSWLLLISFLIFRFACPGIVRHAYSLEKFEVNYMHNGQLSDALNSMIAASRDYGYFGPHYGKKKHLTITVRAFFNRLYELAPEEEYPTELVEGICSGLLNEPIFDDSKYSNYDRIDGQFYGIAAQFEDDKLLKKYSRNFMGAFYVESSKLPLLGRYFACALGTWGVLYIFSPAVFTLIKVAMHDLVS